MPAAVATTTQLRIARPTISVGGQDQGALAEGLLELSVAETIEGLYRCEAKFGNWGPSSGKIGFLYFDRTLLDFGKAFQIKLGRDVLFDGRIVALEAGFPESTPPELTVLAEDRFQDLRMTRRTTVFFNVTDEDVVRQVAGAHGLTPSVNLGGAAAHALLAQLNQSDLAFLRERCRAVEAELWIDGTTLHVERRSARAGQPLKLGRGHELREFTVIADLAGQRSSVTVAGWDVAGKTAIAEAGDDSTISGELDGGTSGSSLLGSTLGQRKESLAHGVPLTGAEAKARAESYFKALARRFVVGRGVAETNAQLRVGARVDISGVGPLFSGKYYVAEVKHLFDGTKGLRTEFAAERPGLGTP